MRDLDMSCTFLSTFSPAKTRGRTKSRAFANARKDRVLTPMFGSTMSNW